MGSIERDLVSQLKSRRMKRELWMLGGINESLYHLVVLPAITLAEENKDPITIYFDSIGGQLSMGITCTEVLRNLPADITSIALATVFSAAMFPYMAGRTRLCYPNSYFLIHPTSLVFKDISIATHQLESYIKVAESQVERECQEWAKITNLSAEEWIEMFKGRDDIYLNAHEALEKGIVTGILGEGEYSASTD
jgi:ATP-dependent protease ClpP protease subunit